MLLRAHILTGRGAYERIVETYAKRESHDRSKRNIVSGRRGEYHFFYGSQTLPSHPSDRAV